MKIQPILPTIEQTSRQYFAALTDKYCPLTAVFIIALSFLSPSLYADPLPSALPTGSQITSGQAIISQNGAQMTINQSTNRLITNWQSFDIGQDASVQFNQPNSSSVALNRIQSTDPTQIMGSLNANGQVYLLNPSGVIFGESARVDVGGLVASSLALSDDDFNNGHANFTNGNSGTVSNAGQIKTKEGGYVAFIAPQVENTGTISTPQGTTALLSGNKVNLDFNGNKLITYSIDQGAINAEINNHGLIQVDSGTIILSAQSANTLTQSVVNQTGVIEANSLVSKGGRILLEGDDVHLTSTSKTEAKGATGGGEILIGGDWQGTGNMHQATTVTMESGAKIDASATDNGDGGKVVLWSDITDTQSVTEVHGEIKAQSGVNGGRGGKVETSGHHLNTSGAKVNTLAENGEAGLWLLDPEAYNIAASGGDITGATIASDLNTSNIEIFGTGAPYHLNINDDINYTGANNRTLTFKALGDIVFNSGKSITSSTSKLNLVFHGDTDSNLIDKIQLYGTIDTNGGGLWVGGGAIDTSWTPYAGASAITVGNHAITSGFDDEAALLIDGANINTQGGHVKLWGRSNETSDGDGSNYGIRFHEATLSTGAGNIDIIGELDGQYTNGAGVRLAGENADLLIETTSGNITITGSAIDDSGTNNSWRHGLTMMGGNGHDTSIKTTSGKITLNGTANAQNSTSDDSSGFQVQINHDSSNVNIVSQTGDIDLKGTNTNATQGTHTAAIRFTARDVADSIRIGYDGTNAYSGDILMQGDRVYKRDALAGAGNISVQSTGALTLESEGSAFSHDLTLDNDWNFGTTLSALTIGKSTNSADVFLTDNITTAGAMTFYGRDIRLAKTLETTGVNADIKLLASRDIYSDDAAGTTAIFITQGGNILLASDTDGVTGGQIDFRRGISITSNGGDITLGGGDFTGSGYAQGYNSANAEGIRFQQTPMEVNSGGGNIVFRGKSFAGVATGRLAFGIGFWGNTVKNFDSGTGTILFDGVGQSNDSVYGWGFITQGATTIQSANTSADAIKIIGNANASTSGVNYGIEFTQGVQMYATGGGGITLTGDAGSSNLDFVFRPNTEILANSGAITLVGGGDTLWTDGSVYFGSKTGTPITASSSDITITSDNYAFFNNNVNVNTSGIFTLESTSASFDTNVNSNFFTYNASLGQTLGGINIGQAGNTANISINNTLSVSGDVNIYGAYLAVNNDILSTGGNITLDAVSKSSDTRGIRFSSGADIKTSGSGNITLTADARLADDKNGYGIDIGVNGTVIETDTGDITFTGTGTAVTGRTNSRGIVLQASDTEIRSNSGTITLTDINPNNVSGTSSFYFAAGNKIGKGSLASSSSNVFLEGDKLNLQGSIDTTGSLSLLSNGSTFLNGLTANFTASSVFSSLTIGKTTNTADITLPNAFSTVGDINIFGGNINLNNSLSSSAGAVLAKATGNIISNGNDITSNGNITLWSDSDASGLGYISLAANSDLTSNGGDITLSGGADLATGYAKSNTTDGILAAGNNQIYSSGGDILLRGYATSGVFQGVALDEGIDIDSGIGSIGIYGKSDSHYGINILNGTSAGATIQSAKTTGTAITIDGQSTVNYGTVFNYNVNKQILATGGGDIAISGVAGASYGIFLSDIDILATTGTITLDGGVRGITSGGSKPGAVIGQKAGSAITVSSSDINIISDVINFGSYTKLQSSGALDIHGATAGTSIGLAGAAGTLNLDATELNYIQNGFSSITFGDSTSGQIISNAYTFSDDLKLISGASGIQLAGALNVGTNNLTLNSTGAVTQSAAITASGLELLNGSFTLNNTSNNVATLAANAGSINYVDSNALNIGTVNTTGVNLTATVSISTQSGDLTVSENIATSDTSNSAIILNAGKATAAGTATDGNILISGAPTLTTGVGGRATLFSGSIAGSTGLTTLIGSGSGRFRYGSDELATNYTSALGTGIHAIYREQPTLTITADDKTVTYGTAPVLSSTIGSRQNGDTIGQTLSTTATVSVGGTTSTSGNYTAATAHTLTAAGAVDQLGYALSYNNGSLTVNKKNLTASYSAINKVYDATLSATATGSSADIMGTDILSFSETASFLTKDVATGKTINVSGIAIAGADASNYNLTSATASTTANITQKAVTVSGLTASNKIYDANTSSVTDGSGVSFTGLIGGDTLTLASLSGLFADKNVGVAKSVSLTSTYAGADVANYAITDQASTSANITQKAVTVSGLTASNKTYDANTSSVTDGSSVLFTGLIGGDALTLASLSGLFADKNVGIGKTVTLNSTYGGADVANYAITDQASTTASITKKTVTVSGLTASNKIYDANTSSVTDGSGVSFTGLIGGDALTLASLTGLFADKNVGVAKTVTLSSTYGGADVANYAITDQASTTANITQKAVTVSGLTASNKIYDANTSSVTDSSGVTFTGLIGGDALTLASLSGLFADKNVGVGKTVSLTSTYAGTDLANYSITDQASSTANITAKTVTVSGITAENKVFDGTTLASIDTSNTIFGGKMAGDVLSVLSTGLFIDSNVGIGKIVNLNNIYGGVDLANYIITDQLSTVADITAQPVVEANNNIPSTLLLPPNSPNASSSNSFEQYHTLQYPQIFNEEPLITIEKDNLHTGNNCINPLSSCEFYNLSLNDDLF